MKKLISLFVLLCVNTSFAGLPGGIIVAVQPLIVKSNASGYVPMEYVRGERCSVFQDKVVLEKSFGTLKLTEERAINLTGDVMAVIEQAGQEEVVKKDNFICDAPSTHIETQNSTVLYSTAGCGTPSQIREGAASKILIDIVDTYCPKTFDFGL